MNKLLDFVSGNKLLVAVMVVVLLVGGYAIAGWWTPSVATFVKGLRDAKMNVETFSGQELKDMNTLVNSGKGGALIFTLVARVVVYAGGVFSRQEAESRARVALDEMTTLRVNGVLVSVWRYPFQWQAKATLALENKIREKDMASTRGRFCAEPAHANRITCSKFESFVHRNFFVTISSIKEKVVLKNGSVVDHVAFDDATLQSVRSAIEGIKH